ncbi:unnamed protein product [Rotaria sordida]|uniref:Uncharacterized protein n=1 Tax=Rotaria sordida TaxID=392033 RepID=A0A815U1D0_9BILA|nr:unnamed protein product [Rotaria sordida]CAF4197458.1 unnamed protein product [Rotaria sordida]
MTAAATLLVFYFTLLILILNDVYCMVRDDPPYLRHQQAVHYCANYTYYIYGRSNHRYNHAHNLCQLPPHIGPTIPPATFNSMQLDLIYINNASPYWDFFAETHDFKIVFPPAAHTNPFNMSLLHISTQKIIHDQTHFTCRMVHGSTGVIVEHINADEQDALIRDWFYCCCPRQLINQENTYVLNTFLRVLRPGVPQYTSHTG